MHIRRKSNVNLVRFPIFHKYTLGKSILKVYLNVKNKFNGGKRFLIIIHDKRNKKNAIKGTSPIV